MLLYIEGYVIAKEGHNAVAKYNWLCPGHLKVVNIQNR